MATITAQTGAVTSNTNGAWVGGVQPGAGDDVVIPSGSIMTFPNSTTLLCRSFTAQSGCTLSFTSNSAAVSVGTSTAGPGNVAVSISSGITMSNNAGTFNLISTNIAQQTVDFGGKTVGNVTVNGVLGSWVLASAYSGVNVFTLTNGSFATANYAMTSGSYVISGTATKSFTPGSSTLTATASGGWSLTAQGTTIPSNTATIVLTASGAGFVTTGTFNFNGTSVVASGAGTVAYNSSATVANFTRTGTAVATDAIQFYANFTATGTVTLTGASAALGQRILASTATVGSQVTITAGAVSLTNVDFMDVVGAGATWSGTSIGDAQGNSGITFTAAVDRYAVAAGNWGAVATWSATSGGAGGASVPLPQDNVFLNAASGAGTYTMNMPRLGKNIDFTGFTRTAATTAVTNSVYGSATFVSGMTFSASGQTLEFRGRTVCTLTQSGLAMNMSFSLWAPGGTLSQQGALASTGATSIWKIAAGTWITNSYSLTFGTYQLSGSSARTADFGTSVVYITRAASIIIWDAQTPTNLTLNASQATFYIATAAANITRTFAGGGLTYGHLNYNIANSPATLAISGSNTFGTLTVSPGRLVTGAAGSIQTVGTPNLSGQKFDYVYLASVTNNYVSIPDSVATSPTGDIDFRFRISLDSWAQNNASIAGKATTSSTGIAWSLLMNATSKQMALSLSSNGTSATGATSTAAVPFTDGSAGWLRFTWRASDGRVQFFTAPDQTVMPSSWSQLGTDRTINIGSLFDSPAPIYLGTTNGSTSPVFTGKFYRAQFRNNILNNGTGIFADVDMSTKALGAATFIESSTNAATVTVTGATALLGDGRVAYQSATAASPTYLALPGVNRSFDYLVLQDVYSTTPFKFYAGANSVNVSGNTNILFTASDYVNPYIAFDAEITLNGTTSNTINLNVPPTQAVVAGDLLVLMYHSTGVHAGVSAPGMAAVSPATVTDTSASMTILTGAAVGGEVSKTITSTTAGGTGTARLIVVRGQDPSRGLVPDTLASATGGNSSITSLSSGAAANTGAPAISIAMWGATGTLSNSVSVSNGYQLARVAVGEGASYARVGVKPLSSVVSTSSTLTWTTARTRAVGRLLILRPDSNGVLQSSFMPFFG